ncbi:MAG: ECF transporter S component [Candidatus Thorarchaeota archaeon]|nr:MAG: ECF transporter S component [Candidatus Thorarchaeota archaeon]RLI58837.1 MAG: ECF transporter S component [Candidatus Thorarchaeota archaeon]
MERFSLSRPNSTLYISLLAVFTALTTVSTVVLVIPIPATDGYFNFGDIMVMMSGFLLGAVGGAVAGGVGSMFADLLVAPFYAPVTLIVKGLEGYFVGTLTSRTEDKSRVSRWDVAGVVVASVTMLLGYFLAEILLFGYAPAVIEMVAFNSLQMIAGSVVALLIGPKIRFYLENYGHDLDDMDSAI